MYCGISGQVPEEPVVDPRTGQVYEKRLIEKHIETTGKCPLTDEDLKKDDLIVIKNNKAVKPRSSTAASIPGLINLMQSEWDSLMLETFQLKQHLDTVRQELSQALYQHDAACRVIARLVRERDEARAALQNAQSVLAKQAVGGGSDENGEAGFTSAITDKILKRSEVLRKDRAGRKAPSGLTKAADMKKWKDAASHRHHSSDKQGILSLAMDSSNTNRVVTGGMDKTARVFDLEAGQVVSVLHGHSKPVSSVDFHESRNMIISGSQDKTVRLWSASTGSTDYTLAGSITAHTKEVTATQFHPVADYALSAGMDGYWTFLDVNTARLITKVQNAKGVALESLRCHPDAILVGTGAKNGVVSLWDLRDRSAAANLSEHSGAVKALAFSENGIQLATGGEDGHVKVWDLRKQKTLTSVNLNSPVNAVEFDYSGSYLAAGSSDIRLFSADGWKPVATLSGHDGAVTGLAWGPNAASLVSTSLDHTLRVYN